MKALMRGRLYMIRIGIDVDNVMADFSTEFVKRFNKNTGKDLKIEDLLLWNFKDALNEIYKGEIDGNVANEILFSKDFVSSLELRKGVEDIFNKICNNDEIQVVVITALFDELIPVRNEWFKKHFNGLDFELHYESNKDKINIDYLIDDGVHNLDKVANKISKDNCLCITQPYNIECDYKSFDTLEDAIYYILYKENISINNSKAV